MGEKKKGKIWGTRGGQGRRQKKNLVFGKGEGMKKVAKGGGGKDVQGGVRETGKARKGGCKKLGGEGEGVEEEGCG